MIQFSRQLGKSSFEVELQHRSIGLEKSVQVQFDRRESPHDRFNLYHQLSIQHSHSINAAGVTNPCWYALPHHVSMAFDRRVNHERNTKYPRIVKTIILAMDERIIPFHAGFPGSNMFSLYRRRSTAAAERESWRKKYTCTLHDLAT